MAELLVDWQQGIMHVIIPTIQASVPSVKMFCLGQLKILALMQSQVILNNSNSHEFVPNLLEKLKQKDK